MIPNFQRHIALNLNVDMLKNVETTSFSRSLNLKFRWGYPNSGRQTHVSILRLLSIFANGNTIKPLITCNVLLSRGSLSSTDSISVVLVCILLKVLLVTNYCLGYKAHTHLAKSLQTRCKTIHSATKAYNQAPRTLDPPQPPLDWSQVSHYSFLDKFSLLHNTWHNISSAPWANPVVHEAIKKFIHVRHAHEEIDWCNIEVRHLFTSIHDENTRFNDILMGLTNKNYGILGATKEYCLRCHRVNSSLLERIRSIFSLNRFTCNRMLGSRKGCCQPHTDVRILAGFDHTIGDDNHDDDKLKDGDIGEADTNQLDGLISFVASL